MGKQWKQWQTLFSWAPKSLQMVIAAMKLKDAYSLGKKVMTNLEHIKKQRRYFANKGLSSQHYCYCSSHVWMWEYKESWALKNWCFWTMVLEKTLESPWTARRSNRLILKEIRPPDAKSLFIWKDPVAGKDWGWEEMGTTEDEMVWWHHCLNGHEFE